MKTRVRLLLVLLVIGAIIVGIILKQVAPTPKVAHEEPGIWQNYEDILWVQTDACVPEDWENFTIFELRQDGAIIAEQEVSTGCTIHCTPNGVTCDELATPGPWLDLPPGTYEVWWSGGWYHILEDVRYIVQPESLKKYEDERRFLLFETLDVIVSPPNHISLPVIFKEYPGHE